MSLDALSAGFSSFSAPGAAAAGGSSLLGGAGAASGALGMLGMAGGPIGMGIGMVANMVMSGMAAKKAATAQKRAEQRQELGSMNKSAYEKALEEYYVRKNKGERRMALENYNQFNTMDQIAPGYKDVYKPGELGAPPDARDYVAGAKKKTNAQNYKKMSAAAQAGVGSVTVPGG